MTLGGNLSTQASGGVSLRLAFTQVTKTSFVLCPLAMFCDSIQMSSEGLKG